ncbi:MAG: hypothetical protein ABFS41_07170 [Myxococcota bacterium]
MRRLGLAGVLLGGLLATAAPGHAQGVRELAFGWAEGDYRAPLTCTVDGVPRQALRRVLIAPRPRRAARPGVRVTFFDLEAPPGTRCSSVSGAEEPNLTGHVDLVWEGRSRPDTGPVDFRNALRRDDGFGFAIETGRLRLIPTDGQGETRRVDFALGSARLEVAAPGTDAARRLAPFGGRRQRVLRLEPPDGPALLFDLVELPGP